MNSSHGNDRSMDMHEDALLQRTRRHFFSDCAIGVGAMALGRLWNPPESAGSTVSRAVNPMAPRPPHFPPRARNVIFLFMAGGPSQLELFEHKPQLQKYHNKPIPDSFIQGKRFAFMDSFTKEHPKLLGTSR